MSNVPTSDLVPKHPAERRVWIWVQLRLRGTSLRRLAAENGVSQQAMSHALVSPSSHLEEVIAQALGLTAQQLFPERFDALGNRLSWTRDQQRNTRQTGRNVEEERVA
jgi:Ner family transcriptional regulator